MFDNDTFSTTTTTTTTVRTTHAKYVKSPFESRYIGGIFFMFSVMFVLLYGNFYRTNTLQMLWHRLLVKLHLAQPSSQPIHTSSHAVIDRLSI
ncbi:unnamed protein product [Adineta steineri]|uniref:Transmembrane protein n=1 Tax=Adineta steineri TaxID=433720 RepID=A0A819L171_9BILA|nr:unnamed protein product [Adineta steineri]CAF3958352.1 unnamed protein product [Adineta steineri]